MDGQGFGIDALAQSRGRGRAAALGEILAANDAGAARNPRNAQHIVARRKLAQAPLVIAPGMAGDGALLVKAFGIGKALNALAHREPPLGVLLRHRFGAAVGQRPLPPLGNALDFLPPAHRRTSVARACAPRGSGRDGSASSSAR